MKNRKYHKIERNKEQYEIDKYKYQIFILK